MFTVCSFGPEQWVPSRRTLTGACSHQPDSQVLLSGSGTEFNECWTGPVESPCRGSALGNREQEASREGSKASWHP